MGAAPNLVDSPEVGCISWCSRVRLQSVHSPLHIKFHAAELRASRPARVPTRTVCVSACGAIAPHQPRSPMAKGRAQFVQAPRSSGDESSAPRWAFRSDHQQSPSPEVRMNARIVPQWLAFQAAVSLCGCGHYNESPQRNANDCKAAGSSTRAIPTRRENEDALAERLPATAARSGASIVIPPETPSPRASIPHVGTPGTGDTPINSGAGEATPLVAPGEIRRSNEEPNGR